MKKVMNVKLELAAFVDYNFFFKFFNFQSILSGQFFIVSKGLISDAGYWQAGLWFGCSILLLEYMQTVQSQFVGPTDGSCEHRCLFILVT